MATTTEAALLARGGLDEGSPIALSERITIIGSAPLNEIVVDEPNVSRRHATIRRDYRGYWIADLDSLHGTFVNGERLGDEARRLRNSDRIGLGSADSPTQWVFMDSQTATEAPTETRSDRDEAESAAGEPRPSHSTGVGSPAGEEPGHLRQVVVGLSHAQPAAGRPLLSLPRNVLLALFGAMLGGELVIIFLLVAIIMEAPQ